jgi:hypothetical protein
MRNQQSSPLLQLPGEIRNAIYEYAIGGCLVHVEGAWSGQLSSRAYTPKIELSDPDDDFVILKTSTALALGKVCRQTRAETRLMFFKLNEFVVNMNYHTPNALDAFIDLLTSAQCSSIKKLKLIGCEYDNGEEFYEGELGMAKLSGLGQITLVAGRVMGDDPMELVFGPIREAIAKQTLSSVKVVIAPKDWFQEGDVGRSSITRYVRSSLGPTAGEKRGVALRSYRHRMHEFAS